MSNIVNNDPNYVNPGYVQPNPNNPETTSTSVGNTLTTNNGISSDNGTFSASTQTNSDTTDLNIFNNYLTINGVNGTNPLIFSNATFVPLATPSLYGLDIQQASDYPFWTVTIQLSVQTNLLDNTMSGYFNVNTIFKNVYGGTNTLVDDRTVKVMYPSSTNFIKNISYSFTIPVSCYIAISIGDLDNIDPSTLSITSYNINYIGLLGPSPLS